MSEKAIAAPRRRSEWISAANVFASLGVVILHCNGVFWQFPEGGLWVTANFLETFFYWPVPIFFMLSGATLMDYHDRYTTKEYFVKRLTRVGIPFVFWSIVGVLYRAYVSHWEMGSVKDIFTGIITTKYIGIYWFFIPLIAIYMSIPLLGAVDKKRRDNVFLYGCICGFVLCSLLPTVFKLLDLQYNSSIQPPVFAGYIVFVMLGYLIANHEIPRKARFIFYGVSVVGWLIQFIGTMWLSKGADAIDQTLKGYVNFPSMLQAVGVMIFFKYFPWEKLLQTKGCALIKKLSQYTFGIYLMHIFFVWHIPEWFEFIDTRRFVWRTGGAVVVFALCAFVSWLISLIPGVKKIIGC